MIESGYVIWVIAAMGLVTFALRALPFVAAQWLQNQSAVQRLGQFLPLAIMTLLLAHSVAGAAREDAAGPWPEAIAVTLTMALQWRSRNALLSIAAGTGAYLIMRNFSLL
ncbi:MAG: AzlD protein [Rhodocyclaceae bacterium]|nr:AzlD protein [Rhodocyclaceae bacterium]